MWLWRGFLVAKLFYNWIVCPSIFITLKEIQFYQLIFNKDCYFFVMLPVCNVISRQSCNEIYFYWRFCDFSVIPFYFFSSSSLFVVTNYHLLCNLLRPFVNSTFFGASLLIDNFILDLFNNLYITFKVDNK